MKVTSERQPGCLVELTIEASADDMAQGKQSAYRAMAPHVPVPGFRPGKAPRNMILRQIGEDRLLTEALSDLLPKLYEQALVEEKIQPYAEGDVHVVQRDPAIIKATVPLAPTVVLGDYKALRLEKPPVVVEDSDIEDVLARLQDEHSTWVPAAEDRLVMLGDQVVADLKGTVGEQVFVDRQGAEMLVSEERGIVIPGLATELVGAEREVTRSFLMVLPETFSKEEMRGKAAEFTVTVHEIKEKQLPALDDEFAKTIGEAADMAELRQRIRDSVQHQKEQEGEERFESDVLAKVIEMTKLEYPLVMVEEEVELLVRRAADRWKERGLDLDTYLKITQKSPESFRSEMEPEARHRLEAGLVLGSVAEAEHVTVEASEIEAEAERMSQAYGDKAEEALKSFSSERARRSIASILVERKSIQRLVAIATGAEAPSEAAAKPEEPIAEDGEAAA